mmetsp:Transcript_88/g.230  ORF Transcript_88/g.230 Transcript_88/m.230 type:complete len:204 (+) Transcript_88:760-1371(+)
MAEEVPTGRLAFWTPTKAGRCSTAAPRRSQRFTFKKRWPCNSSAIARSRRPSCCLLSRAWDMFGQAPLATTGSKQWDRLFLHLMQTPKLTLFSKNTRFRSNLETRLAKHSNLHRRPWVLAPRVTVALTHTAEGSCAARARRRLQLHWLRDSSPSSMWSLRHRRLLWCSSSSLWRVSDAGGRWRSHRNAAQYRCSERRRYHVNI